MSAGFSIGTALLLAAAFATAYRSMAIPWQSRAGGFAMLGGLAITQWLHAEHLSGTSAELATRVYAIVLFIQSIGFYWLFLGVLRPKNQPWHAPEWVALPLAITCGLLLLPHIAIAVAMIGGTAVSIHLAILVYRLRAQRRWFLLELRVLAVFGLMAIAIAATSAAAPALGWSYFAAIYSVLISASFALVLYLLLRFPDIPSKAEEAVTTAYATSTLSRVDCEIAVAEIKRLFDVEKIYTDESLSLAKLAEMMKLSPHQASELINTQFEVGFSRLVRQYRVDAAKKMLINEPRASVLSVGLSVGFTSQSNFYVAFKEITGVVPGQFRKTMLAEIEDEPASPKKIILEARKPLK